MAWTYAGLNGTYAPKEQISKHTKPLNALVQSFVDAGRLFSITHVLQPAPLVLGLKPIEIYRQWEAGYNRHVMDILIAGAKLERLALQLEILRGERDAFLTMREVTA